MNGWQRQGEPNPFRDLEQIIHWLKNNSRTVLAVMGGVFLLLIIQSALYTVQPNEEGVVLRLGKYYKTSQPGLNFLLPFVDQMVKIKTSLIHQEEFGFRSRSNPDEASGFESPSYKGDAKKESIMLTGDLNVADVQWIVQYQISDPQKFLFGARDPIQTIRDISQAMMRRVVGDRLVSEVLTTGRIDIAAEAQTLIQTVLNNYDIGIHIVSLKLQDINPPDVVKPSFNEVNAAKQEQEKVINLAEQKYNSIIPKANGEAEKKVREAEGYATMVINQAKGDTERFNQIYAEYAKAPEISKKRLYLEQMQKIYSRAKKATIIDGSIKGLLPIFGPAPGKTPTPEGQP